MCRCGHDRDHHQHYRPGTDCGTCGHAVCPRYRRDWTLRLRRAAATVALLAGLARDVGRPPRTA